MTNTNLENLPPELQARIKAIMDGNTAQQAATQSQPDPWAQPQPQPAPIQRPPTLMDHCLALRQEVAALRQELNAVAQVTEAVGSAVGQLYQTFLGESQATNYSSTYQTNQEVETDY